MRLVKAIFFFNGVGKDAKIIYRNIKPKNIVYDSISQTYSITNFKYSKLKNSHKLIKNYENDEKEEKEEDQKFQNELNRRFIKINYFLFKFI